MTSLSMQPSPRTLVSAQPVAQSTAMRIVLDRFDARAMLATAASFFRSANDGDSRSFVNRSRQTGGE